MPMARAMTCIRLRYGQTIDPLASSEHLWLVSWPTPHASEEGGAKTTRLSTKGKHPSCPSRHMAAALKHEIGLE